MIERKLPWQWYIKPQTTWLGTSLKELYTYKDLLFRLVRKEFLSSYQQTLLGPFWVLLLPILTVCTSVLIFNKIIGVSTEGVPPILYYLAGITLWNLFSDIFLGTAITFTNNAQIFNKVYFPRIIVPLSTMALSFIRLLIQLAFLLIALLYYYFKGAIGLHIETWIWCIPVVLVTAAIGLGAGLIFSILTAKYRDLLGLLQLFIRLFMFVCPIFYPMSIVPEKLKWWMNLNPLSTQFELFRYVFLGKGIFTTEQIVYSVSAMFVLLAVSLLVFNRMGDKLIDVI